MILSSVLIGFGFSQNKGSGGERQRGKIPGLSVI